MQKQLFHLTKQAKIRLRKPYSVLRPVDTEVLRKVLMQLKTDMPVLGLAGRHKQWKLEAGTQS